MITCSRAQSFQIQKNKTKTIQYVCIDSIQQIGGPKRVKNFDTLQPSPHAARLGAAFSFPFFPFFSEDLAVRVGPPEAEVDLLRLPPGLALDVDRGRGDIVRRDLLRRGLVVCSAKSSGSHRTPTWGV